MRPPQIRKDKLIEEGLEEVREATAAEAAEEARFKAEIERIDEEERKNFGFYMDSLYPPLDDDDYFDDFFEDPLPDSDFDY